MKRKIFVTAAAILTLIFALIFLASCDTALIPTLSASEISANPKTFEKAECSSDGYATVYIPYGKEDIKILVLSDPQVDSSEKYSVVGSSNKATYALIKAMVEEEKPNLVIITGDLAMCSVTNNWRFFKKYAEIFEELKTPWTFAFGNHDCENNYQSESATVDSDIFQLSKPLLINELNAFPHCLINTDKSIADGYGNHFVNVRKQDGSLVYTLAVFDCLYDTDDGEKTYSHVISDAQTEWYKNTLTSLTNANSLSKTVPSLVFTHVPLPEAFIAVKELGNPYKDTDNTKYLYGQQLGGDYSRYAPDSQFFDAMLEMKSTREVFFGHFHDSDLSLEYKGIKLTYVQHSGLSHNYRTVHADGAYGKIIDFSYVLTYGDMRGGNLVSINQNGVYKSEPVYAAQILPNYATEFGIDYHAIMNELAARGYRISPTE